MEKEQFPLLCIENDWPKP